MNHRWRVPVAIAALSLVGAPAALADVRIDVGSPGTPFPRNKQNEPAVAIDAHSPNIVAAGSNDEIDLAPCGTAESTPTSPCPFTTGVGVSGIYFSLDGGSSWTQPTYTGRSARTGTIGVGPIGTLPKYLEAGLASDGDPALAFGPRQLANGQFSWSAGSRLYYVNLTSSVSGARSDTFKGFEAIAVSRTDDVPTAAQGGAAGKAAWKAPVIVSRQNGALFSDKEQVWADNAALSPYFGNVYVCNTSFRSVGGSAEPILVSRSTDGGSTWRQRQVTRAANNASVPGRQGCTLRTDSRGVLYVFFEGSVKKQVAQVMVRSFDGGRTFDRPRAVSPVTDTGSLDPVGRGDLAMDGVAGVRSSSFPSLDIANGAPSGKNATNRLILGWNDGRDGLNREHALVQTSTDRGDHWTAPVAAEAPSPTGLATDRPEFAAVAISPDGTDAWLTYDAHLDPFRTELFSMRRVQGVVRHATVTAAGIGAWSTVSRGGVGDTRGSSTNSLTNGFMGDYNYIAAAQGFAVAVYNDARTAAVCPAVNAYRQSLVDGTSVAKPNPATDCPAGFGDTDIFGGRFVP